MVFVGFLGLGLLYGSIGFILGFLGFIFGLS